MSGMDIAERRVPQDGRFNVKNKKREFDLRVNSLPTVYGEKIVARLLDKRAGYLTPDSIGLMGDNFEEIPAGYPLYQRCYSDRRTYRKW